MLVPGKPTWKPQVNRVSAKTGLNMEKMYETIQKYRIIMTENGELEVRRQQQRKSHMWTNLLDQLTNKIKEDQALQTALPNIERMVVNGEITAGTGADILLSTYMESMQLSK